MQVARVSHRDNLQTFVQKSENLEKQCLTMAIKSYCELRVLPYEDNKTVVFWWKKDHRSVKRWLNSVCTLKSFVWKVAIHVCHFSASLTNLLCTSFRTLASVLSVLPVMKKHSSYITGKKICGILWLWQRIWLIVVLQIFFPFTSQRSCQRHIRTSEVVFLQLISYTITSQVIWLIVHRRIKRQK